MKRLTLILLFLSLTFGAGAPVWGQACATPAPTYTPTPGYRATVQAVSPGNLLVYYPLNETSGSIAEDDSGNNADGTYSGVTLNSGIFLTGDPAGSWDGVNDYVDFYTAYLSSNLNPNEGTILVWIKVDAGFATDGVLRAIVQISVDTNNRIHIRKIATNALRPQHIAGGTTRQIAIMGAWTTNWMPIVWTWSGSNNTIALYHGGASDGTTTGPGTWAGSLSSSSVTIGSADTSGSNAMPGSIAQVAVWNVALNATQAALLATIDPTQIIPPTATLCPSYTPTETPTASPTFTPTPSNTPDLNLFWTLPAPIGTALPDATGTSTPAPGQWVRFEKTFSAGQAAIALELGVLTVLLLAGLTMGLLRRGRS